MSEFEIPEFEMPKFELDVQFEEEAGAQAHNAQVENIQPAKKKARFVVLEKQLDEAVQEAQAKNTKYSFRNLYAFLRSYHIDSCPCASNLRRSVALDGREVNPPDESGAVSVTARMNQTTSNRSERNIVGSMFAGSTINKVNISFNA